jgi:hypothetical protein
MVAAVLARLFAALPTIVAMAYDEDLADRIRELIVSDSDLTEKKMFGGLAFLIGGNMAVAASVPRWRNGSRRPSGLRHAPRCNERSSRRNARPTNAGMATSRSANTFAPSVSSPNGSNSARLTLARCRRSGSPTEHPRRVCGCLLKPEATLASRSWGSGGARSAPG